MKRFSICIPVYNEQECIRETNERVQKVVQDLHERYECEVIFIDDGSSDRTVDLIKDFMNVFLNITLIKLTRNCGHQIALTAGLDHATGDYIGIIDGDLQDPPELFPAMLDKINDGYDIVYGKRISREGESFFKLISANAFYCILSKMCNIDIPRDTGDFRVISRRALSDLNSMREKHRFLRGLVPFTGYKSFPFLYDRKSRFAGETKYPLRKMIHFSLDAIFSFSTKPIKFIRYIGLFTLLISIALSARIIFLKLTSNDIIPGYTSAVVIFLFFTSIQMISLAVIGEYVGRIFEESKGRPLYFLDYVLRSHD